MSKQINLVKLENTDKMIQYIPYHKDMITISYNEFKGITTASFYNINNHSLTFSFSIEFNNSQIYDQWQIYNSKINTLYLIGYMNEYKEFLEKKENKKLGIFLLDISKRNIEKIRSYKYNHFIIDKNTDKIFITNNGAIIAYDFGTNISKEKSIKQTQTFYEKFILVGDWVLLLKMQEVLKWMIGVKETIIVDKNLANIIRKKTKPYEFFIGDYNCYGFINYKESFVKISDNKYFIYFDNCSDGINFYFSEINIKGNEHILTDEKKLPDLFDEKVLEIKEKITFNISLISLDDKNFVINLDNNIFYICDAENLTTKTKIDLNLPLNNSIQNNKIEEKDKLLSVKIQGGYYEFIFITKNNEIKFISNK